MRRVAQLPVIVLYFTAGFTVGLVLGTITAVVFADHEANAECYSTYSAEFCDEHAVYLAEARPVFDYLVSHPPQPPPPQTVPNSWGRDVPVPAEWNQALDQTDASELERSRLTLIAACESDFNRLAKNPHSTASGVLQFLRGTWSWVAGVTGYTDVWSMDDQAQNGVWLARAAGWSQWECWGRVR